MILWKNKILKNSNFHICKNIRISHKPLSVKKIFQKSQNTLFQADIISHNIAKVSLSITLPALYWDIIFKNLGTYDILKKRNFKKTQNFTIAGNQNFTHTNFRKKFTLGN